MEIGDRVLVRNLGLKNKHKLSDRWEEDPYVVVDQPNPDIPVFKVRPEKRNGRERVLHRNLLLPCNFLPPRNYEQPPKSKEKKPPLDKCSHDCFEFPCRPEDDETVKEVIEWQVPAGEAQGVDNEPATPNSSDRGRIEDDDENVYNAPRLRRSQRNIRPPDRWANYMFNVVKPIVNVNNAVFDCLQFVFILILVRIVFYFFQASTVCAAVVLFVMINDQAVQRLGNTLGFLSRLSNQNPYDPG